MLKKRLILKRISYILLIFAKYGFSEFVCKIQKQIRILNPFNWIINKTKKNLKDNAYQRFRLALEELGSTFIKFGQVLSMRPDLLPEDLIAELQKLQDQVPPFPFSEVKKLIANELSKPFNEIFKYFKEEPEAAASIAQVHYAHLLDGSEVAVKIKRPDLQKKIELDLEVLIYLAQFVEKIFPQLLPLKLTQIAKEFSLALRNEIDFYQEARNIECFASFFSNEPTVHIPKLYQQYCTKSILVLEYINGIKVSELEKLKANNFNLNLIAQRAIAFFFRQILELGFFHADPHFANIFILPGNIIAPLDFGMIGFLNDFLKIKLAEALKAFTQKDVKAMLRVLSELEVIEEENKLPELSLELEYLFNYFHTLSLAEYNLSTLINEFIHLIRKYHISLPVELILMAKTICTLETLAKTLNPSLNFAQIATPYVKKILLAEIDPSHQFKKGFQFLQESSYLLKKLPSDLDYILKKIKKDKLKIHFENQNFEKFIQDLDKSSNRISISLVISAFIIGSSLLSLHEQGPTVSGLPLFSLIGFMLAAIGGIALLIGILRSGRL